MRPCTAVRISQYYCNGALGPGPANQLKTPSGIRLLCFCSCTRSPRVTLASPSIFHPHSRTYRDIKALTGSESRSRHPHRAGMYLLWVLGFNRDICLLSVLFLWCEYCMLKCVGGSNCLKFYLTMANKSFVQSWLWNISSFQCPRSCQIIDCTFVARWLHYWRKQLGTVLGIATNE